MVKNYFLKYHKFILFISVLSVLLLSNYYFDMKSDFFRSIYEILEKPKRQYVIWIICIVVCGFYYFYVVAKKRQESQFLIKTSMDFLDFVSAFCTYSAVANSSLNLFGNILKEFVGDGKLFVNGSFLDFYIILACALLPVIWVVIQLYNFVFIIFSNDALERNPNLIVVQQTTQD